MINRHFVSRFATKPWEFGPRWLWYFDFERDGIYRASSETLFSGTRTRVDSIAPEYDPAGSAFTRAGAYATRSYQRRRRVCAMSTPASSKNRSPLRIATGVPASSAGHANVPCSSRF